MNAKVWQSIAGLSYYLMFLFLGAFLTPSDHPLAEGLQILFYLVLVTIGLMGGWFGVRYALGKLRFGCPFCWTSSPVVGGTKRELYMNCPSCGSVRVTCRPFRTATAARLDSETE